ncbi:MAG: V-type ATP synthase subunit E [Methanomassiliicoccales archaeon PtaU1.Bin124]|nr:MAG: V-type ATP synthase subunit E [Methanomassiliicoccales archaeon PtaU1.Bin124]
MALDNVVGQILDSANKDADKLIQEAEKEKAAILNQADDSIAAKKKAQDKEQEVALVRLKQQELSSAELEAKRIVLNAKKEVLDETFRETLKELNAMPASEKSKVYAKIIAKSQSVIINPKVYCPKGDGSLVQATGVRTVIEKDMEPGLILESDDGSISLDYRFKTILEGVWEKELKNISNVLFG